MQFKEVTSSVMWCHPYLLSDSGETLVFLLNSEYFGGPSGATKARSDCFTTAPHVKMCSSQALCTQPASKSQSSFIPSSPQNAPPTSMCILLFVQHVISGSNMLTSKPYDHTYNVRGSPAGPACEQRPGELTTALVVILGRGDPIFCVA